ncbi:MAG: hypothetical protein JW806_08885 [Sedimentisphaerales bacterium]|nr:hypothetical protein [Sedimentisphaerales bacterium]
MNLQWLPKIIAILLVIDALVALFRPDIVKKYCQFFSQGTIIYLIAAIDALIGIALLLGGAKCNLPWAVIAIGILAIAVAFFIVAMPQQSRAISNWFGAKNTITLRFFAIIYLAVAAFLVYASG